MVKVSTLFYVFDDTEKNNELVLDLDSLDEKENQSTDVSNYFNEISLEVDQRVIDRLLRTLSLI